MATIDTSSPNLPKQLHVKLSDRDAKKLLRLAKGANLSISEAIRSMIRTTAALVPSAALPKETD